MCLSCALDCDSRAACVYLSCLFATDSSREESLQYERMVSASPEEMKIISSHQSEKLGIGKSRDTRISLTCHSNNSERNLSVARPHNMLSF